MTHDEAIRYLESVRALGIRLGLETIAKVLSELGEPQRAWPSVLIGGTNGKGSVAAMLESVLRRSGRRTGLYTSPHLIDHEERIAVDGAAVSKETFGALLGDVRAAAERLERSGAIEHPPTEFEILTAAGFLHFARSRVDVAVVEVGMGGRLDATVLARPVLSLITNVELDHTAFLGPTIAAIAREKSFVLPPGGTLVTAETRPEALDVLEARAREVGGTIVKAGSVARAEIEEDGRVSVATGSARHASLEVSLKGPYQRANVELVVAACEILGRLGFPVAPEALRSGLRETVWPGRFQIIGTSPLTILDGAHNPAAARALRGALESLPQVSLSESALVIGVLKDKDSRGMMEALAPGFGRVILTRGASPRFLDPEELIPAAKSLARSLAVERDLSEAMDRARRGAAGHGAVCVTGSLALVGDALRALGIKAR